MVSVWVHHLFPALVKLPDYPKVCSPNIEGFDGFVKEMNHDQRVAFWRAVMSYAHDRGMKFYFFNWNIHLEHAEDQYPGLIEDPKSNTIIDYMYKNTQALLESYPELDGFGIVASSLQRRHGTPSMLRSRRFRMPPWISRRSTRWLTFIPGPPQTGQQLEVERRWYMEMLWGRNFTGTKTLAGANITGKKLQLRIITKVSASDEYFF